MANVFNKIGDIRNSVKRNSFDWSHDNNFTTDLGRITPVFTELVPPNSSVRIKPEFGLRFMPMMFPIQTKMRAYLSFYKVPLRTLWRDYMDFISSDNSQEFQPPFIAFSKKDYMDNGCLSPSGLGDYFSIPVAGISDPLPIEGLMVSPLNQPSEIPVGRNNAYFSSYTSPIVVENNPASKSLYSSPGVVDYDTYVGFRAVCSYTGSAGADYSGSLVYIKQPVTLQVDGDSPADKLLQVDGVLTSAVFNAPFPTSSGSTEMRFTDKGYYSLLDGSLTRTPVGNNNKVNYSFDVKLTVTLNSSGSIPSSSAPRLWLGLPYAREILNVSSVNSWSGFSVSLGAPEFTASAVSKPVYYGEDATDAGAIKISAYPFRAYESIYNAYIRNTRNNPFVLDGKKTYNRWITNDAGGSDTTTPKYLRYANWQSDAYTTALQSPQQGTAPLVGLTTYESTVLNDAGHSVTTINTAIVDEDGNAYKVDFESNGEALKGVNYTPLKSGEAVNMQALVSPVTSGISINDFRNVNAYQRYLELNQFRGFSYKEIIEGRFDVNVRYDALNMPEYLGGITRDVIVNPITQTVETSNTGSYAGALGSQSGLATCFGNSDGSISVFCDEESIVMGIMYVMPMPVYDTLLPKYLTYRERLDSFNPEFDHIGYQPIRVSEIAAVQARSADISPDTVFGYQRPWYEYVQKPDRAHGLFLSSLRNFIMFRSFANVPELGSDFTVMQPGSVNNVFMVTEVSDKILGQIHFDCTAQLPISRVVVPRLE